VARITVPRIQALKEQGKRIVCVTAYDAPGGALADAAGVDLVLVGDSLGNVVLGFENTLPVTLEDMVRHTAAVARAVRDALLIADLPFGSYQEGAAQAVRSSVALMRAGAHGVKLEGVHPEQIEALVRTGIPVMGHVGMTPQSVHAFGGFRVQGRDAGAGRVRAGARALQELGCFSVVLELIPMALAAEIAAELTVPTIGIGAGPLCDGQIQVFHDVLGFGEAKLKHARRFADARGVLLAGLRDYAQAVREGAFPAEEHAF
jgi:3-methyl-2-oxobutanoate hydroxymethyltransferase